jgi:hypothetical protein
VGTHQNLALAEEVFTTLLVAINADKKRWESAPVEAQSAPAGGAAA